MLPFRQRVCIVLWVLVLVWSFPVLIILFGPYVTAKSETFPLLSSDNSKTAFVVPMQVVEAYKVGLLNKQQRMDFENDLRSGQIALPQKTTVTIPPHYPEAIGTLGNFAILIFLPVLGVVLIQFLFVGFANPFRLFKPKNT